MDKIGRYLRLGMHSKVEKIGIDTMSSPIGTLIQTSRDPLNDVAPTASIYRVMFKQKSDGMKLIPSCTKLISNSDKKHTLDAVMWIRIDCIRIRVNKITKCPNFFLKPKKL